MLVLIGYYNLHQTLLAKRMTMDPATDFETVKAFATALLIGALIGFEREKRKTQEGNLAAGGLRTFIVCRGGGGNRWLALSGSEHAVVAYRGARHGRVSSRSRPHPCEARANPSLMGITTEIAAIATYLLGAMAAIGHTELAVGLAIATAAMLAYKHPLHGAVTKLGWDDVFAGLRLLIASFIVLPLLPNRAIDPWGTSQSLFHVAAGAADLGPIACWLRSHALAGQ